MKSEKTGLAVFFSRRIMGTLINSAKGLRDSFKYEEAFRLEAVLAVFLIPAAIWIAVDYVQLILLIGAGLIILIVELLNTGIEAAIDRIRPEFHELSGRAKDAGSAAVLVSLGLFALVWGAVLWENFL